MTVLEASELTFSITNTQYQVASSFGRFHAMNRFIKSFIPLQDISEDKGEGISESALFSKGRVWVADTNLGNGDLMLIDSWKYADPSNEANVEPGIAILGAAGMIDNC